MAALAPAGPGYVAPILVNNNPVTRHQEAAAINAAPAGTLLHAALVVAGVTEDAPGPPIPAHRGGRSTRAVQVRPPMGAAMAAVHANFFSEDAAAPSNAHATTVLYRDLAHTFNGMPIDEWNIYFGTHVQVAGAPVQLAVQDLFRAVVMARGPLAANRRIRMRIDFWYTTRSAVERPSYHPPTAYLGGRLADVPRLVIGTRVIAEGSDASIRARVRGALHNFNAILQDQQPGESDRIPDRVVCAQVWAVPSMAGRGVGHTGRLGFVDTEAEAKALGEVPLPKGLHACRGLVLNFPAKVDTLCVARAIMTALDPFLEASSDANLVNILGDALAGARAALAVAQLKAKQPASPGIAHSRALRVRYASDKIAELGAELASAKADMLRTGRRVRTAAEGPDVYRAINRYKTIERELAAAFRGEHPLVTFQDPFFSSNPPINEETLPRLRACIKPGFAAKIQIWGISVNDKIGLVHPDTDVSLDFVRKGGRVLNILVAFQHASFVRDVGTCCNRATASGALRGRFYCSLCGHSVSIGAPGYQLKLFAHQQEGCVSGRKFSFAAPLSSTNRCQLKQGSFAAKERAMLTAVLSDKALHLAARLPSGWATYNVCDPFSAPWWHALHKRFMHGMTADVDTIGAPSSSTPDHAVSPADCFNVESNFGLLTAPSTVSALLAQLHWECPKDYRSAAAVGDVCVGCHKSVHTPSVWKRQSAPAPPAPKPLDDDEEAESDASDDEDEEGEAPESGVAAVVHHCHATGACASAHADCNACIRQSMSYLYVETTSLGVLAAVAALAASQHIIEKLCDGKPPRISIRDGRVRGVTIKVAGLPRPASVAEQSRSACTTVTPFLTIAFRSPDCTMPQYQPEDGPFIQELLKTAEANFAATHLWMPSFPTSISYARGVLHDYAARADCYATSIVSADSYASAKRITPGGIMVLGERVESPPLSAEERRYKGRFYFDITASYPTQLQRWALPLHEHLDRPIHDFTSNLAGGLAYIHDTSLERDFTERVEIWGFWPVELHEDLRAMPPVFQRIPVSPKMLSRFQRLHMGLHMDDPPQLRSVGHLFPVEGAVVFMRMAKLWQRLGMVITKVGTVWSTPAKPWGRDFATDMERKRRAAAAAGDKAMVAAVKQVCNSVIGSLNVDASKFTTILAHKAYLEEAAHKMSTQEKFADNPRFTLRSWSLGDCTLYELEQARIVHKQQTLAALFIQAMAQCDLLELWYGRPFCEGMRERLTCPGGPPPVLLYGNTDSLFVEVQIPPGMPFFQDVRHFTALKLLPLLDLSNVPKESTFFSSENLSALQKHSLTVELEERAGRWGLIKEETGFAGIEAMVVNGPNRYGFRIVQSDTDTLPEHRGTGKDVLKSLPRAWKDADDPPTLEDFYASWLMEDERVPPPLPPTVRIAGDNIGELIEVETSRAHVSPWGNAHCIVSRTAPYPQWPLGCALEEAQACVKGTAW